MSFLPQNACQSKKVGVFHTAFIGDLALCGSLIEGLYAAGHQVYLITNTPGAALYAHDSRIVSRVVVKKGKGFQKLRALFECARVVRSLHLDVLLVPHRSFTSTLIAFFSGVPRTVGFSSAAGSLLYGERRPYPKALHESERLSLLAPEDLVSSVLREQILNQGRPSLQGIRRPTAFFEAFPELESPVARFFLVSPGSVWKTKQYPADSFAAAAEMLLARHPSLVCVVAGGPSDAEALSAFFCRSQLWPTELQGRLRDATKCIPLADLPLVLARALFSLANDSAPLHIACGVGSPVVGIYGPTSPSTGFGPLGPRSRVVTRSSERDDPLSCQPCSSHGAKACPLGHWRCMAELSPRTVALAAESLVLLEEGGV